MLSVELSLDLILSFFANWQLWDIWRCRRQILLFFIIVLCPLLQKCSNHWILTKSSATVLCQKTLPLGTFKSITCNMHLLLWMEKTKKKQFFFCFATRTSCDCATVTYLMFIFHPFKMEETWSLKTFIGSSAIICKYVTKGTLRYNFLSSGGIVSSNLCVSYASVSVYFMTDALFGNILHLCIVVEKCT